MKNNNKSFKQFKILLLRFWRSEDDKVALIRDVLVAFLIVFMILLALWTYTGQWFGAPMVAIESGSMMHLNEPFGRLGTIDAGDMVLLVKVNSKNDISPYCVSNDWQYGKKGDVIVYKPMNNPYSDQIIHRAMCWVDVEYNGSQKTYTIEGTNIVNHPASEPLYLPELGIWNYIRNTSITVNWSHSGFITKGDNPISNPTCDQLGNICDEPVKLDWISGKARGELPWIGTINLFFNDIFGGKHTVKNVPPDSLICLVLLIAFLVSIPVSMDIYAYYKEKNSPNKQK